MATTNEQINIKLQLDAAEAEAIALRVKKTLEDAAVAATRIKITPAYEGANVARSSSGRFVGRKELEDRAAAEAAGTTYVKPVKRSSAMAAAQAPPPISQRTVSDSSLSRSVAGQTGSDSRDFAKQAQGLGGLVHVYATFAANAFAASAAFTALSKAADTSNMITGLQQLSASGGVSLTALAKQMVSVSDGAISLRQAMSSTALAASSGMTSSQILRMTEIAKKASLALGRDMTDSMDRLTKGIVKIQPELLDELGIMARVIPSQQAYARSVGKSVDALTQYEKQLAFTQAVLTEGTRKFNDIDIDSNSFSKLSAALDNVVFSGLRSINVVLEPIVKLLSASPTGLSAVLAGIAAVLLKQAIPALGQFREGAEKANALSLTRVSALFLNNAQKLGENDGKIADNAKAERQKYETSKAYIDLLAVDKEKALKQANAVEKKYVDERKIITGGFASHEQILERSRASALATAAKNARKISVQETAEQFGSIAAYRKMNEEILNSKTMGTSVLNGLKEADGSPSKSVAAKTNAIGNAFERVGLIAGIAGGGIMRLVGSLGAYGAAAAVIIAAGSFILSFFKSATQEAENFDRAVDHSKDTLKTYDAVVKKFSKQPAFDKDNIEQIIAYTAAILALVDATEKQVDAYEDYLKKRSAGDRIEKWTLNDNKISNTIQDGSEILRLLGFGSKVKFKLSDGMEQDIAAKLEADLLSIGERLKGSAREKGFTKGLSDIFNIDLKNLDTSSDEFKKIIKGITYQDYFNNKQKLIDLGKNSVQGMAEEAAAVKEFSSGLQLLNQDYDAFNASLTSTDPFMKLGNSALKFGILMGKSFDEPKIAAAEFKKFIEDTGNFRLFSPELQKELVNVNLLATKIKASETVKAGFVTTSKDPALTADQKLDLTRKIAKTENTIRIDTDKYDKLTKDNILQQKVSSEATIIGLRNFEVSLSQERQKAGIEYSQKLLSLSSNSVAGIKLKGELDKKLIDVQNSLIEAVYENTVANYRLGQIYEAAQIDAERDRVDEMDDGPDKNKASSDLEKRRIIAGINKGMLERKTPETLKELNAALSSTLPPVSAAAVERSGLVTATLKRNEAIAASDKQKQGIDLTTGEQTAALLVRQKAEILDFDKKILELRNQGLSLSAQDLGYQDASIVNAKFLNQQEIDKIDFKKKQAELQSFITQQQSREKLAAAEEKAAIEPDKKEAAAKEKAAIQDSIKNYNTQLGLIGQIYQAEKSIAELKNDRNITDAMVSTAKYLSDIAIKNNTLSINSLTIQQDILGVRSQNLAIQKQQLEENSINQEFDKQQLTYAVNAINNEKELRRLQALPRSDETDVKITAVSKTINQLDKEAVYNTKKAYTDIYALRYRSSVETKAAAIEVQKIELDIISQKRKLNNEVAESNNALKQSKLSNKIALESITELQAIQEKFNLDLDELKLSHANKLKDIEEEKNRKALEFELTLFKVRSAMLFASNVANIKAEEQLSAIRMATEKRILQYKAGIITESVYKEEPVTKVDTSDAEKLVAKAIRDERALNEIRIESANKVYTNNKMSLENSRATDIELLKRKQTIDSTNKSIELLTELSGKLKDNFAEAGEQASKLVDIFSRTIKSKAEFNLQAQKLLTQGDSVNKSISSKQAELKTNEALGDGPSTTAARNRNTRNSVALSTALESRDAASIATALVNQSESQLALNELEQKRNKITGDRLLLQQQLNELGQEQKRIVQETTILELKNIADKKQVMGDFFALVKNGAGKETAAYKIAAGMERKGKLDSAVVTAANFAKSMNFISKETALKITSVDDIVVSVAQGAMKMMGIQVPAIFGSFMAALGPFGPPLASAAIAAFMGVAAGGGDEYKPLDYEKYQKDKGQGNGTGGILGDSTAVNTGIADSLSYLAEVAKPEFAITSLMAKILQNIDNNTFELAYGKGGINSVEFLDSVKQASTETKQAPPTPLQAAAIGGGTAAALNLSTNAVATATAETAASLATTSKSLAAASTASTALATANTALATDAALLVTTTAATAAAAVAASAIANATVASTTLALASIANPALIAAGELALGTAMVAANTAAAVVTTTAATAAASAASVASTAATVATSISSTLASVATALGPVGIAIAAGALLLVSFPKVASAVSDFLFGSETVYTSLAGFGVVVRDQTLSLASSNVAVEGFKDTLVQVGKSAGFFEKLFGGGYKLEERIDRSGFTVNEKFKASLQKVYDNIGSSLTVASKSLKIDPSKLSSTAIKGFEIDLSKGTEKEKQEKLSGEIGKQADALAESLMDGMQGRADVTDFKQKDESSYKTYLRLAAAQEEANFYTEKLAISGRALANIDNKRGNASAELVRESIMLSEGMNGISEIMSTAQGSAANLYDTYTKLKEVQISLVSLGAPKTVISADLVRGAGGTEALSRATQDFENIYLTSAERLKIKQATVDEQFKKLGLTTPKTAEDFKQLVLTLAKAGPTSEYLLGSVLALSDSYKGLTDATKDATAANAVKLTNEIRIYELLGYASKALELTRQKELDTLDKDLIASQKYIYALEDEISARDKLNEVYKSTTASITNQIKSLKEYKTSLNTGASSILTPQEKYSLAKADFESTAKAASAYTDINSTPADIAKRDDAISNLSKTAETFRETSSVMFASGAQYVANVKSINTAIDDSISSLTVQETDIKKQLGFLDSISSSSKSTAQLLGEYLKLQGVSSLAKVDSVNSGSNASTYANTISKNADGGLVHGISLVGERGPEIVDFSTPGRVYSNAASNDIFSTKELVAELKALRTEVSHLRQEQKEQTGHIITSNYDANRKNADKLSEVTENAMNQQSWKERNKVMIV